MREPAVWTESQRDAAWKTISHVTGWRRPEAYANAHARTHTSADECGYVGTRLERVNYAN